MRYNLFGCKNEGFLISTWMHERPLSHLNTLCFYHVWLFKNIACKPLPKWCSGSYLWCLPEVTGDGCRRLTSITYFTAVQFQCTYLIILLIFTHICYTAYLYTPRKQKGDKHTHFKFSKHNSVKIYTLAFIFSYTKPFIYMEISII